MSVCDLCGFDPEAETFGTWTFLIPHHPRSHNQLRRLGNHAYGRERDAWKWHLLVAARAQKMPPTTKVRRRVVIERLYTGHQKRMDLGNFVAGCKPVLDSMIRAGLLADDSERWLEDHYRQVRSKSESGLRFTLTNLERP